MDAYQKRWRVVVFFMFFSLPIFADVTIGFVFFNPPFVFNESQGFDIDLADNLCTRLKLICKKRLMPVDELYSALQRGEIDLAMGGLVISKAREGTFIYSMPYMLSRGQFVSRTSEHLTTLEQLRDKNVGVMRGDQSGTAYYNYLKANDLFGFKVLTYKEPERLMTDFYAEETSAVFLDKSTALYWIQNSEGKIELLGDAVVLGSGIGIISLPTHRDLVIRINQGLMALENDGTYLRLYRTYLAKDV